MAGQLPGNPSQNEISRHLNSIHEHEEVNHFSQKWYFSKQEIDAHSPSRKDGISQQEESYYQKLYCKFLQELGIELKVPQLTIATAIMFCHRFYMRQSHAKNCWKTIATACMFVGCKVEETSRRLSDVIVVAYKQMYKWDPSAPRRIKQKDVYDKQKELIINGERFLLATLAFNLNIEHPYKSLVGVLKRLEISDKELLQIAWNFVNDWLHTTLCLQYKPHYVAAGSVFLAAKIRKVKLLKEKGKVWWMQFDVSPKILEEVVQQMTSLLKEIEKQAQQSTHAKHSAPKPIVEKELSGSPQSCILNGAVAADSGVLKSSHNAVEGLSDSVSVSSKCDMKQVNCDIHNAVRETSRLSGAVAADSRIIESLPNAKGLNDSVSISSKCDMKQITCDVHNAMRETSQLSGEVAADVILKSSENAKGLNDSVSVSSKCDMEHVTCDVHNDIRETSQHPTLSVGKLSPARPQSSKPSGSPLAQNPLILAPVASAVGFNDSVLVKCNGKQACSDSQDALKETKVRSHASDCGSANSAVEDCEDEPVKRKSDLDSSCKIVSVKGSSTKIDIDRIRDAVRKRKHDKIVKPKVLEDENNEMGSEAWIQRELENGITLQSADTEKRMRL